MSKKRQFLKDKPSETLPKRTRSLYVEELFKISEKAINKLRRIFN